MKKKRIKKILFKLMWLIVWVIVPTALFLAWDVLILGNNFDQYTITHAASCAMGIIIGIGICKIPGLLRKVWRRIRKYWYGFLHIMAIFFHAMMLEDDE